MGGPREIEDKQKERLGVRRKVLQERVRHAVRTGCCGGREIGKTSGEFREAKRGTEALVVGRSA